MTTEIFIIHLVMVIIAALYFPRPFVFLGIVLSFALAINKQK